jgi:hypothetical protein
MVHRTDVVALQHTLAVITLMAMSILGTSGGAQCRPCRSALKHGDRMPKYLFLQRSVPGPAQMQDMYAAFNAWKEKFKDRILDRGGPVTPGRTIVTASGATDGPFPEAKEIVGGFMIVSAASLELALEVARESPPVMMGSSVEVREIREVPSA